MINPSSYVFCVGEKDRSSHFKQKRYMLKV